MELSIAARNYAVAREQYTTLLAETATRESAETAWEIIRPQLAAGASRERVRELLHTVLAQAWKKGSESEVGADLHADARKEEASPVMFNKSLYCEARIAVESHDYAGEGKVVAIKALKGLFESRGLSMSLAQAKAAVEHWPRFKPFLADHGPDVLNLRPVWRMDPHDACC
jgi:hypothetical protein